MIERLLDDKRARLAINLLVILGLAWAVSLWIHLAISQKLTGIPAYKPPQTIGKTGAFKQADYSVIKRRNIFNPDAAKKSAALPKSTAQPIQEAVQTALNLKLIGTVFADMDDDRYAVIQDKGTGKQDLFRINDEVAPGASIIEIHRLAVLIDNGGRIESLTIEMQTGSSKRIVKRKRGAAAAKLSNSGAVRQVADGHVVMDRKFFDSQLTRVNDLMTQVRAIPHKSKDGTMQGFKVFQIRRNSLFQKVGLKNHDVIQRINGQQLDSVEKGLDLFTALREEHNFVIDIIRNNSNKTLTIEIQ